MVEMSCGEHDIQAASSQFITHTVGRMLGTMELSETTINTKGYESLLSLVNNTYNDSFDLYYGLFMYNKNATAELSRLELAFSQVKAELFDRLHTLIRDDIFEDAPQQTGLLSGNGKPGGPDGGNGGVKDRGFKDRLIDRVNSTGTIGGRSTRKRDERARRARPRVDEAHHVWRATKTEKDIDLIVTRLERSFTPLSVRVCAVIRTVVPVMIVGAPVQQRQGARAEHRRHRRPDEIHGRG